MNENDKNKLSLNWWSIWIRHYTLPIGRLQNFLLDFSTKIFSIHVFLRFWHFIYKHWLGQKFLFLFAVKCFRSIWSLRYAKKKFAIFFKFRLILKFLYNEFLFFSYLYSNFIFWSQNLNQNPTKNQKNLQKK